MAKHEELKTGVWVRVLQPHALSGMVLGPLPADAELPQEERSYIVATMPDRQYHRPSSLELSDPPKIPGTRLEPFSDEWNRELEEALRLAKLYEANPNDSSNSTMLLESLRRLGVGWRRE